MGIDRRGFVVATVGVALAAGCTGVLDEDDSDEAYDTADEEELYPPASMFGEDWGRDDDLNPEFEAGYRAEDRSAAAFVSVSVVEDVEEAESTLESTREANDGEAFDLADGAFWVDLEANTLVMFRHSNAICEMAVARRSDGDLVPDQSRATSYAREIVDYWESL